MIRSLFIANRGEIAMRVIRACRELDIISVLAYSKADKDSIPVRLADKSVCVGDAASGQSYLHMDNLIAAASGCGCDAVHPGVGFLSENAVFAQKVHDAGLVFVGPSPKAIALLGDKVAAKNAAIDANVPIIPGTDGVVKTFEEAEKFVQDNGYPIIIKAASGGGGKGMRIVHKAEDLQHNLDMASNEAEKSFSDKRVYIERFLSKPRHVEIQLMADAHGNTIHFGERDCTVQMRHQKLIEESPSPAIDSTMRREMGEAAVRLLSSIGYENAGTVEFLVDEKNFYFMEVNARIQVEHPVTELVTGVDLIEWQLRVSAGEVLSYKQEDIVQNGYAMECRINALTPGRIERMFTPGGLGVRVDTWIGQGSEISPFYDSLVMKLLVHAKDRASGIVRMQRALEELELEGEAFSHNKIWFQKILSNSVFRSGKYTIQFLEETKVLDA